MITKGMSVIHRGQRPRRSRHWHWYCHCHCHWHCQSKDVTTRSTRK